jgi:putative ABC transport system permease protein
MIDNWIKTFIYHLKQNKLFSFLNVLGLSIGISGLIFALLYWNDEQSYDAWNPEKDNVHQVLLELTGMPVFSDCALFLKPILDEDPNVETILYADSWYQKDKIIYNGKKEFVNKIINVESNFFSFFPFKIVSGDAVSAIKDDSSIAISDVIAKRVFADENPIGKQITCLDQMFVVRAVYHIPGNSSIAPDVVMNKMKEWTSGNTTSPFVLKLLLKVKDPSKIENTRKSLENLYNTDFVKRIAKEEGFTFEEMAKKIGHQKRDYILLQMDILKAEEIISFC